MLRVVFIAIHFVIREEEIVFKKANGRGAKTQNLGTQKSREIFPREKPKSLKKREAPSFLHSSRH